MLASISPVGEAARGQRWSVTATAYLVASAVGGATTGALAGALGAALFAVAGRPPTAVLVAALAVLAGAAVLVDRGVLPLRVPSWHRQVDETWLTRYRGWVYGAGFGFQLGAGVFTRIPSAAFHLVVLAAAATGSVASGALVGVTFGIVRALPLLLAGRHRDPAHLNAFHRRMDAAAPVADRVTSAVVAVAAAALVTTTVVAG
jgi:cytochrome c biogenesis protein CcdA